MSDSRGISKQCLYIIMYLDIYLLFVKFLVCFYKSMQLAFIMVEMRDIIITKQELSIIYIYSLFLFTVIIHYHHPGNTNCFSTEESDTTVEGSDSKKPMK